MAKLAMLDNVEMDLNHVLRLFFFMVFHKDI